MNIPISVGFTTTASTPFYFLPDCENTLMVKNVLVHNNHSGSQKIHLTYKNGVGTALDFYNNTASAGQSFVFNDIIIVNPGDSLGCYGNGNSFSVLCNFVIM